MLALRRVTTSGITIAYVKIHAIADGACKDKIERGKGYGHLKKLWFQESQWHDCR